MVADVETVPAYPQPFPAPYQPGQLAVKTLFGQGQQTMNPWQPIEP